MYGEILESVVLRIWIECGGGRRGVGGWEVKGLGCWGLGGE